ncbi:hypothetical protein [Deinococcus reticulitermitis]|uniref:hypothetical protein n=1 Tax=Deinococcus reticulitermitis TaxID=856736 RepID=UPI003CCBE493
MLLEEGDATAADARLVQTVSLHTLQASLTGESLPVGKNGLVLDVPLLQQALGRVGRWPEVRRGCPLRSVSAGTGQAVGPFLRRPGDPDRLSQVVCAT